MFHFNLCFCYKNNIKNTVSNPLFCPNMYGIYFTTKITVAHTCFYNILYINTLPQEGVIRWFLFTLQLQGNNIAVIPFLMSITLTEQNNDKPDILYTIRGSQKLYLYYHLKKRKELGHVRTRKVLIYISLVLFLHIHQTNDYWLYKLKILTFNKYNYEKIISFYFGYCRYIGKLYPRQWWQKWTWYNRTITCGKEHIKAEQWLCIQTAGCCK